MPDTVRTPLFYGLVAEHILDSIHSLARSIELLPEDPEYSNPNTLLQEAMNKVKIAHLEIYWVLVHSGKVRQEELHTQEEEFFFTRDDKSPIPPNVFEPEESLT